uniref:Uncharacterized protein n=1 Tax=Avena sativa TaxID=4498 RepID=A0ACD5XPB9_AVESA
MEHLWEFEEEPLAVLADPSPTTDDSVQGRGTGNEAPSRETWGVISTSLGTMRPLVGKLDKLLLAHPNNDRMLLLSNRVKQISSYIDELSEVEDPPRTAKCWMNEARGLSYDMEDYIDNSLLFVLQPHVYEDMEVDEPTAAMVSKFCKYVQEAIERYKVYVEPSSTQTRRFVSLGPMLPTSYEDIVIDGRMNEFINSFTKDDDKDLKVVSVLGSACLGKTTLTRVLYNKLGNKYNSRAFVRVSRKPDTKRIFREMLWQLQQREPPEYRNEVDLIDNIKKYLRNKRYLIIIDDIWDSSVWDIIDDALPKGSHRSRIVTTTQIKDVALTCCSHQSKLVFEMKPLDDDHSRELFFNKVFGSECDCPEIFQEISNKIVEICGGLPLATMSIASLLASQPVITEDLLEHIHESLSSYFSGSSTLERTRQALNLSFNNLPHYLKTCLLSIGMYPEGYTFFNDDLVKQWNAEGFIDTTKGQDAKKVAESYLHELIGRRFIQPIRINYNDEVLTCAVLDTVHDLIAQKSAEENFIVAIDSSQKNVALSRKAHRLSLLFGDARYAKIPTNITKSQLRSLNFFGILECMPCITEYKLLRVLVLQISVHGGEDNPVDLTGISELIHLRYLKIGCGICIKLPTDGLKCLETLDIADAIVISSSREISVPRLLHLSLPIDFFNGSLKYPDSRAWSMWEAGRLNYLEDLYITFSSIDFPEQEGDYLGTLIQGHGNLRTAVFSHGSKGKTNVFRDTIAITSKPSNVMITSGASLLQRFECSRASGITFFRIPKWIKDLENLCILKISVSILEISCLDTLNGLHALASLSLCVRRETLERIIFDKAGFSALKCFNLRFRTGIPWIKFEKDTMPNLWKLKLVFNAIPRMDGHFFYVSSRSGQLEQYKHCNALIDIEHMPSLRETYAKFGGAAADLERIKTMGISIDPRNPTIAMQLVDSGSYGDQQGEKDLADETLYKARAERRSAESLHVFTLDELMSATSNFSMGHFQGYYKSNLNITRRFCRPGVYSGSFDRNLWPGLEPQKIVVKCINKFSNGHEWMMVDQTELEYLGTVCHPNVVKLLGFCDYYEHRMLVYEDTPKKSLEQYLCQDDRELPWLTRLKIAVGTAKGLAFLHEADKPMVHGDSKASRGILLDKNQNAKLFGYSLVNENSADSLMGKSDVFNFGAVLLELLAGRKKIDERPLADLPSIGEGRDSSEDWWRPYLSREDKMHHIIDPRMKGKYPWHAASSTATMVRRCLHSVPEKRPSMRDVVQALEPLLLLIVSEKPSETIINRTNNVPPAAGGNDDEAAGGGGPSSRIQLDLINLKKVASIYHPHEFTLGELMSATGNFSKENLLGEADFGHIYKGAIDSEHMVAVMKLRPNCDDWLVPRDWQRELQLLESTSHPHLVRLLGYCDQDDDFALVYEYVHRGFLSEINLCQSMPWLTRLNIAVGVAKGLAFLLESREQMIYYTGFNASSVVLGSDYTAKLWGFGPAKQNDATVPARMTTEVYNFGVLLLELLAGQQASNNTRLGPEIDMVEWWRPYLSRQDKLQQHVIDPRLKGQYSVLATWSTAAIVRRCLYIAPEKRPSMRGIVEALEPLLLLIDDDEPPQTKKAGGNEQHDRVGRRPGTGNDNKRRKSTIQPDDVAPRYPWEWTGWHIFTLDELMYATSNLSEENLIGEADFGHIYKGAIDGDDGKLMVAVMKLRPDYDDWLVPSDWLMELNRLDSRSQPHLVKLLGYCHEHRHCLLVYEYMSRGSLSDINVLSSIPWLTRLEIAVGAAKGLSFVHESKSGKKKEYPRHRKEENSRNQMIYYTGFTASNIVLASDYTAKLWGFGPAKENDVMVPARMQTDVYNFGVLLLELLAGRPLVEEKRVDPEIDLGEWLFSCMDQSYLQNIIDPCLQGKCSVHAALSTANIAWRCLQRVSEKRPSIWNVAYDLEPLLELVQEES